MAIIIITSDRIRTKGKKPLALVFYSWNHNHSCLNVTLFITANFKPTLKVQQLKNTFKGERCSCISPHVENANLRQADIGMGGIIWQSLLMIAWTQKRKRIMSFSETLFLLSCTGSSELYKSGGLRSLRYR